MQEKQAKNTYPEFMLLDLKAKILHLNQHQIEQFIQQQPEPIKETFNNYYQNGFTQQQTAKNLNTSTTTIRNRLNKLKSHLKKFAQLENNLTLIVGRSGTGKSTIETKLKEAYDLTSIESYTTRPKRSADETGHTFILENELNDPKYKNKIASTIINGYTYFATKEQMETANLYVIDPNGLYELTSNFPDKTFNLIYLRIPQRLHAKYLKSRQKLTNESPDSQRERLRSENEQFDEFERKLKNKELPKNINILKVKQLLPDK